MADPNVDVPQYPNIPNVPGAPAVHIDPSAQPDAPLNQLTSDDPGVPNGTDAPQWGIFDSSNNPVIDGDSVVALDYRSEFRISNFPIEEGSFASYNKVNMPWGARVSYAKGGAVQDRNTFVDQLEAAKQSLDLYSVVMPEFIYINANVLGYNLMRRDRNGVTLLTAEVLVEEVRIAPAATLSNTAAPSGSAAVNDGAVQSVAPTAHQSANLTPGAS